MPIPTNLVDPLPLLEIPGLSAGALNADLLPSTDVSAYRTVSLHVTGTWSGTLTAYCSNDGIDWRNQVFMTSNAQNTDYIGLSITGNNVIIIPVVSRYMKVTMTSYSSGTALGLAELFTQSPALIVEGVYARQYGGWTVTSNAGTNLNTSALALESGGNLATLAGIVSSAKAAVKAASGDFADGANSTFGAKADARSTATDTTAITAMQVLKQISYMLQNPASTPVTGTFTSPAASYLAVAASMSDTTVKSGAGTYLGSKVTSIGTGAPNITDGSNTIDAIPASSAVGFESSIPAGGIACATSIVVKGGTNNPNLIIYYR